MTYTAPPGSIPTLEVPALDGVRRVHMIGVGGAGMNGIAQLLLARGIAVSGSDLKASRGLDTLRDAGADVWVGHQPDRLHAMDPAPRYVVISSAIPARDPERLVAEAAGMPVIMRAQAMAALTAGKRAIAVAGTHGKTTTTSMLSVILERCGADPTYLIGGDLNESGSGARSGAGPDIVVEADESDGSFLLLTPATGIVTNVEEDHLDFYGSGEVIIEAFAAFMTRCETVVADADDAGVRQALQAAGSIDATTFAVDAAAADARITPIPAGEWGAQADLTLTGESPVRLRLRLPGTHNLRNATAAVLAARGAGIAPTDAAEALESFSGVRRRFEARGEAVGVRFIDDYAHHPTEIAATLRAAGGMDDHSRLIAVFQPHRYSRTEALWRPMGESLGESGAADVVVVTDVYAAGEDPIPGVSGKLLIDALAESEAVSAPRLVYLPRRSDVVRFLAAQATEGDLVLTLGAGDITTIPDEALERLRAAHT